MDIPQQPVLNPVTYCMWCLGVGTSRCGRCHSAYYCCRQHQIEHWVIHKKDCKKQEVSEAQPQISQLNTQPITNEEMNNFSPYGSWCQNNLPYEKPNPINTSDKVFNTNSFDTVSNSSKTVDFPSEDEIFSSLGSEILSSDNNFWDLINTYDAQNLFDFGTYSEKDRAIAKISEALQTGAPTPKVSELSNNSQLLNDVENMDSMQCASLHDICTNVVYDLSTSGICVLDNFIGSRLGSMILNEVKQLYNRGIFEKGELVNSNPYLSMETIRSDVTTWIDGSEQGCDMIGSLIKKLDVVVTTCNKLPNNGLLSKYKLHRRTKAMIACYPGDGTYYKKHVDNPHRDGRCITCIYYLNQNWDIKHHGGLLRMFPSAHETQVANIEPVFDRMIFFWSDKRNPHEVLPSFATRFAITVWYFDADERDKALMLSRERNMKARSKLQ